MGMLSLTFRGPFLFVVPPATASGPSPTVNVYAPRCQDHLGSVFYGNGSSAMYGNLQRGDTQVYTVSIDGLTENKGAISYQWDLTKGSENESIILFPENINAPKKAVAAPQLSNAYYSVTVPRPKIYYALNPVQDTEVVNIKEAGDNEFTLSWATSFRLYYDWDLKGEVSMTVPASSGGADVTITPPAGAIPGAPAKWLPLADAGDIEFQFEGPETSDPDHQDASSCFAAVVALAGLPWWLNFNNGPGSGGPAFRIGSDCLAIPIVIGVGN